jgi:hypothetical protein
MSTKKREYKNSIKIKNLLENDVGGEIKNFIIEKVDYLKEIIRNTIISIKLNKQKEIFSDIDSNLSINALIILYDNCVEIAKSNLTVSKKELDNYVEKLQKIIDKLSLIMCGFGTMYIEDLIYMVFGNEFKAPKFENVVMEKKSELIHKYIKPVSYKIINWKQSFIRNPANETVVMNKIIDDAIEIENVNSYECFDCDKSAKSLFEKINGIKIVIQNEKQKKTLVINGIIDEIPIHCYSNAYIDYRLKGMNEMSINYQQAEKTIIDRIIKSMGLKDILIYGNKDIYKKMIGLLIEINTINQERIEVTIKKYLELEPISKRNMLMNMLIYNKDENVRYICYLLHDLIIANNKENENELFIYESMPWNLKKDFNDVVKQITVKTNEIIEKFEISKISIDQQIYMLKADDCVKEKALIKLKEIKGKPEDMGAKAKQYLEGLVKIPFGVYKEENILKQAKENNKTFINMLEILISVFPELSIEKKKKYTTLEILKNIEKINQYVRNNVLEIIKKSCSMGTAKQITSLVQSINYIIKQRKQKKIQLSNQTKPEHITNIIKYLESNKNEESLLLNIYDKINKVNNLSAQRTLTELNLLKNNAMEIEKNIKRAKDTLDESIHSHDYAKNQLLKIFGQWMNGEQKGYSFGFEGSPGIGKTSLAKNGLSKCLVDENGKTRPFYFIALGGSSSGSTIEGHGYTYASSCWGKIVEILMDAKCMNPIIYVDELDKVSKTESGKEIINIFMHLIDNAQNTCFQDKYFSGIDLDLSKVLFIFSYNDPKEIDKILLDRIHRIKFENLTTLDKVVIVNKYIIPELNKNMGFENIVELNEETIKFIIEYYTMEPGVRKLKEILFDLYGEINLEVTKYNINEELQIPIRITNEMLEKKYLVKYRKINKKRIHEKPEIGIISGLWANSLGTGGIIPIQTRFFPSATFLELKLTGLQGDVMKESMNVAKTLAWDLTEDSIKTKWIKAFEETKCQGLHIHCPEGAVSKDGPSAGAAITTAIYSLLNNKLIKNEVAITGEISLSGEITEIGGLEEKINGGIKAGIRKFLYPKENRKEYEDWKNKNLDMQNNEIEFIEVKNIIDILNVVFV